MGRNLGPALRRELENLDKDADSRKAAMKNLKTYVKDLDSKAIPLFLAQVSETKDQGSSSGEYTISLYEVLARVHGRNIVPQIPNIMATVIRTLSSSASSFPLHQACSKVVPAIARYGIEPTTPPEEKTAIIASLCRPLCDALMVGGGGASGGSYNSENLPSGAALCLKALVESDNWRFASVEMVNELCLKTAGALEDSPAQANAHMGLVMALSKHNALIVEAYARSLLRSGLRALEAGAEDGNSQKRFSAIQMVNFLMKCVDARSVATELGRVMDAMDRCNTDPMPYIQGAAYEALMTARAIAGQKSPKCEVGSCSPFRREQNFRDLEVSPESQTMDSFVMHYGSLAESPLSTGQSSCQLEPARRPNRRLWSNDGSGGVDVSLRDGIFSCNGNGIEQYTQHPSEDNDCLCEMGNGHTGNFSGFIESSTTSNLVECDGSPTPTTRMQRPRSPFTLNDVNLFTTPRKLLRSLQDSVDNGMQGLQNRRHSRVPCDNASRDLTAEFKGDSCSHNLGCKATEDYNQNLCQHGEEEHSSDYSESISSNGDVPSNDSTQKDSCLTCNPAAKNDTAMPLQAVVGTKCRWTRIGISLACGFSVILPAAFLAISRAGGDEHMFDFVPT